jgi:hypothetical protein
MTIQLSCGCGKKYQVPDEYAGKRTKCKACGAVHVVPEPEPIAAEVVEEDEEVITAAVAEEDETEVIPAVAAEEDDPEVITAVVAEDDKRKPDRPRDRGDRDDEDRDGRRGEGKKRKRRPSRAANSLAEQYMAEARENMRREELRALGVRRGDDDKSWTLGGVHITAGVISGATLLIVGLLCIVLIAIFKDDEEVFLGPRIFIGAIGCTVVGIGTLVKSIFFGEED